MTEKTYHNDSTPPEKLLIDNATDFQFHAAYLAYSDIFNKMTNPEAKKQLNQNITALQQKQMDYPTFYQSINQYREQSSQHNYGRAFIKTQKKRDWRRTAQRRERNKRHGK